MGELNNKLNFILNDFILANPEKNIKMFKWRNRTILLIIMIITFFSSFNLAKNNVEIKNNNISEIGVIKEGNTDISIDNVKSDENFLLEHENKNDTQLDIVLPSETNVIEHIKPQIEKKLSKKIISSNPYNVQLIAGFNFKNLEKILEKLTNMNIPHKVKEKQYKKGTMYILLAGPFNGYTEAKSKKNYLDKKLRINSLIKKVK